MKNAIKSVFSDDLDVLTVLQEKEKKSTSLEALRELFKGNDGGTPEKGIDYFTDDEAKEWKKEILEGATPQKFIDYFTEKEIEFIMNHVREGLLMEVTPIKGVHYNDGKPGKDAKEVNITALKDDIIKDIRVLDEKQDEVDFSPEKLAEKLNTLDGKIDPKSIKGWVKIEDVVKAIKTGKLLELRDIKGARLDMNDQRWHGGGLSSVSTDATLTGNGTPSSPLHVVNSGSGLTVAVPTGSVDDTNTTFTVGAGITAVFVTINGLRYRNGSKVGGVNAWSQVGISITTQFPVGSGGDIYLEY